MDMNSLREVKFLGCGSFAVLRLVNSGGDLFRQPHLLDEVLSDSFIREFEALFGLSHPCVVASYVFSPGGEPAIEMKYVENG
jgi:hypothetical protein